MRASATAGATRSAARRCGTPTCRCSSSSRSAGSVRRSGSRPQTCSITRRGVRQTPVSPRTPSCGTDLATRTTRPTHQAPGACRSRFVCSSNVRVREALPPGPAIFSFERHCRKALALFFVPSPVAPLKREAVHFGTVIGRSSPGLLSIFLAGARADVAVAWRMLGPSLPAPGCGVTAERSLAAHNRWRRPGRGAWDR